MKLQLNEKEISLFQSSLNSMLRECERERKNKSYSAKDKRTLTKYLKQAKKMQNFLIENFGRLW